MKLPLTRIAEFVSGATTGSVAPDSVATAYFHRLPYPPPRRTFFAVKGEKMTGTILSRKRSKRAQSRQLSRAINMRSFRRSR